MDYRAKRIRTFEETMRICSAEDTLRAAVSHACTAQQIIWQEDEEPRWTACHDRPPMRITSAKRSFEAARTYAQSGKKVCVLNFASSVSPGGGVTYGSQAQEESLCRVSSLYAALSDAHAKPFYTRHWEMIHAGTMKRENRDDCIYTPGVVVVREDARDEPLLESADRYTVDVITCAAPDLRPVDDSSRYAPTQDELMALLVRRWRRILAVAAANGAQVLILGAFGCGVFANPPWLVAQAFDRASETIDRCFETIEFAVYSKNADSPNLLAFAALDRA
ncbi:MAG: TIGR02452 family protein [Clostridia bacterium]|nr:TIGR02452 family protein [Clostridia bacterium]